MLASDIPVERREEIIEKLARRVVDMRLTPLAIIALESGKPLSFVGSQLMVFFEPIFTSIFPFRQYDEVAALLEERPNLETLIQRIEQLEDERHHAKGKDNQNPGN